MMSILVAGATTENLPPGVLYKVKASYKYQAEDVDELNFEVGEVIDVIEYEDPDDHVSENDNGLPFCVAYFGLKGKAGCRLHILGTTLPYERTGKNFDSHKSEA